MNVAELRRLVESTMRAMPQHAERLRSLDAALGDGDLGITVTLGSSAVADAVAATRRDDGDDSGTVDSVLLATAKAFMTANPSTFAALIGGGLLAAARTVKDRTELTREDAVRIGRACADSIATRGKSELGDKTVLDTLVPSVTALEQTSAQGAEALEAMIEAAQDAVTATARLRSAKGRAGWLQERSVGLEDPGSVAFLLFLTELKNSWGE